MSKVLVFCLDGCTYDVVQNIESDFFKWLMENSRWGRLEVEVPPGTSIDFPVFFTGKNPAKIGNFIARKKNQVVESFAMGLRGIRGDALWDILDREEMKTISYNLPVTYPAKSINGIMISSFDSTGEDWVTPSGLKSQIVKLWRPENDLPDNKYLSGEEFFNFLLDRLECELAIAKGLLANFEWDLALIGFLQLDRIQHQFLNGPKYLCRVYVEEMYKQVGRACQILWETAKGKAEDVQIFVVCDHGMRPTNSGFYINSWLHRNKLLSLPSTAARALEIYNDSKVNLEDIDFRRSKAWTCGLGGIVINDVKMGGLVESREREDILKKSEHTGEKLKEILESTKKTEKISQQTYDLLSLMFADFNRTKSSLFGKLDEIAEASQKKNAEEAFNKIIMAVDQGNTQDLNGVLKAIVNNRNDIIENSDRTPSSRGRATWLTELIKRTSYSLPAETAGNVIAQIILNVSLKYIPILLGIISSILP